jgi:raffinose/stachyose/melibiose transport system substrate-binding protein
MEETCEMKRALLLLVALGLAGCSGSAATPSPTATATAASGNTTPATASPTPAPTKRSGTITVMMSQDWVREGETALAKQFEDETGIHVDYQTIPSAQYFDVLNTKLAAGQGPDIFGGQSGKSDMTITLKVESYAVDLSDQEWVKREDPTSLEQTTLDGKVWGQEIWDITGGSWVMVYNKDIFQSTGATVPKTFDDLMSDCDKIKAAGITPIYEPISDGWHHVLWFPELGARFEQLEPGLADKLNANQATFAGDANMTTAMTQIDQLYTKSCFGSNALSATYADKEKQMASGKFAMMIAPLSEGSAIHTAFPDVAASTFGYFVNPVLDNQLRPSNPAGPTKFINAKSPNIDLAKQYLAYLAQPENLQFMLDNTPSFLGLNFEGVKGKWDAEQQALLDNYPVKTIVYQSAVNYVNPQWMDIGKDMVAMFTGKETPAQVMKAIDTRRTQEAKAAKDPAWP